MLHFEVVNNSIGNVKIVKKGRTFELFYPCDITHLCTPYFSTFPSGVYKIELYGGSGGYESISSAKNPNKLSCIDDSVVEMFHGNVLCNIKSGQGGAGGYVSGIIRLKEPTDIFITLGGMGAYTRTSSVEDAHRPKGGYNGGGRGTGHPEGSSGGGGATDLRIGVDDLFHRIIIAGGGGGSDNCQNGGGDDGSGGAGGGLEAQGFWVSGVYRNAHIADQISGFSFGQGEAAQNSGSKHPDGIPTSLGSSDRAGGGGGWFGGFSSHHGDGGGGGGSSFVLTSSSVIPNGETTLFDDFYEMIGSGYYAFTNTSQYVMYSPDHAQGVWAGNGFARITYFDYEYQISNICPCIGLIHKLLFFVVGFVINKDIFY